MLTQIELSDDLQTYVRGVSLRDTLLLRELREETAHLPLASMQVSAEQGQFLATLVRALGARRTLEVGVFTGYSLLSTTLALPADGRVVACDSSRVWTTIAMKYLARADVSDKVDLRIGDARESLQQLLADGQAGTFDFAFVDADKVSYQAYYEAALELLRPGGTVAFDNVLWSGLVVAEHPADPDAVALRAFNESLHFDERIDLSLLPYGDGLTIAVKR